MKRNLILCCAGALLLCVTACSDTEGLGQSQLQQQSRFTLTAHADSYTSLPETRTVVGGADADGSLEMLWSPGDSIGVFSASGSDDVPYVNSAAEASATAVFTGSMDAGLCLLPVLGPSDLHRCHSRRDTHQPELFRAPVCGSV